MFGRKKQRGAKPAAVRNNKPALDTAKPAKEPETTPTEAIQKKNRKKQPLSKGRTASGKVPQGRTLSTHDNYLPGGKKTGSQKERPVVVIEANTENDLAVVPLPTRKGSNRTHLKNYQQGQSYFKHYVEIEDDEGNSIQINQKFRENSPSMDVSAEDVEFIKDKVFNHSRPMQANQKKIEKFRKDKKIPRD